MSEPLAILLPNSRCAIAFSSSDFRFAQSVPMAVLDRAQGASDRRVGPECPIADASAISPVIQST